MSEQWMPITENPEWGFISNFGRVKNQYGKIRKAQQSKFGYLRIGFEGGKFTRFVHRLVAEAFLNRGSAEEVNHKDCNKLNNQLFNLEWVSKSENIRHAYDNNLRPHNHRKAKLLPEHRQIIMEKISCGMTQREIAAEFGVGQPSLNVFLRGKKTNNAFSWRKSN